MLPKTKIAGDDFVIYVAKLDRLKTTIVVSKKVAKRAVDRNRIKRIIVEALRGINAKGDFRFILKNNIADQKMTQIKGKLTNMLTNSKFEIYL